MIDTEMREPARGLLSDEHFSVDGTLIQAWASLKSFRPKDGSGEPPAEGRNGERDFKGEKRSNETHRSTTDDDARLFRKGDGQQSQLCFIGMGITYLLIPLIFRRDLVLKRMAQWQPYLFGIGALGISLFMMGAGTLGVSRRHWDITFSDAVLSFRPAPLGELIDQEQKTPDDGVAVDLQPHRFERRADRDVAPPRAAGECRPPGRLRHRRSGAPLSAARASGLPAAAGVLHLPGEVPVLRHRWPGRRRNARRAGSSLTHVGGQRMAGDPAHGIEPASATFATVSSGGSGWKFSALQLTTSPAAHLP